MEWIDILKQQPKQGQRILTKGASVFIVNYNRFDWLQWPIKFWKPIPFEQNRKA